MDKNGLTAHWYYSSGCNFACEFCYAFPRKIETKEIDEFKMIDSIKDAGFTFLVFTGEPLLRKKECLKVVRYACESGLKVGLDTNGILMDDSTLDFLKNTMFCWVFRSTRISRKFMTRWLGCPLTVA